jgi:uncharacterized protein YjbI with pentapeptide repeats
MHAKKAEGNGMANQEYLNILKQGVDTWNEWREEHIDIQLNLSEANLSEANLSEANLSEANLIEANLIEANLSEANLSGANLSGANLSEADLRGADLRGADLRGADLRGADLRGADLSGANLYEANLSEANLNKANLNKANLNKANLRKAWLLEADLSKANLFGAYLSWTNLYKANLQEAELFGTYLKGADLREADLSGADLRMADLSWTDIRAEATQGSGLPQEAVRKGANLSGANLSEADLRGADLSEANLRGANLHQADFSWANLSSADFSGADLTGSYIYATSAWDIKLEGAIQSNLIIRNPDKSDEPAITVDNLEVAQFIYLLLNDKKIREVIDAVAKKAVLILGSFTPKRKAVLDALREALRTHGYLPIMFDFEKPSSQDLTETVTTLAHLSRFIIADLTDPSCIPYELHAVVPNRMVPVLPLLEEAIDPLTGKPIHEFAMFHDLRKKCHWVLPTHSYKDLGDLLASLEAKVIEPAEQKVQELEKR